MLYIHWMVNTCVGSFYDKLQHINALRYRRTLTLTDWPQYRHNSLTVRSSFKYQTYSREMHVSNARDRNQQNEVQ